MSTEKLNEDLVPPTGECNPSGCDEPVISNPGMVVVQGNEYVQAGGPTKQSHLCCGCCCDTRRAVIVVNMISMFFATLAILSLVLMTSDGYAAQFDDDEVLKALDEIDGKAVGMTIGFAAAGFICNAWGLFGATKFNRIGIVIAGIWYAVECIRSLYFFDLAGAIMAGLFAYPHVIFYQEMQKGIMSPLNYPNEEQCCKCCV